MDQRNADSEKSTVSRDTSVVVLTATDFARRALQRAGVETIGDLLEANARTIRRIRGVGKQSIARIRLEARRALGDPDAPPPVSTHVNQGLATKDSPFTILEPSTRLENALAKNGVETVGDFLETPLEKIGQIRGLGRKRHQEAARLRQILLQGLDLDSQPPALLASMENSGIALSMPWSEALRHLPARARNALARTDIHSLKELILALTSPAQSLDETRGFGPHQPREPPEPP